MPTQVIIIRHGEKPSEGNTLCQQGVCRAVALAQDFVPQFGKPSAIYAMGPGSDDSSLRPIETVTPLANALGLPIRSQYTRLQFQQVAADVESNSGMVLISWEHKAIPALRCRSNGRAACSIRPGS
jgi:broad specificity phosphatase PhoE